MASPRLISRKLRSLVRAGPRDHALLIEAIASLAVARASLAVFPFRKVAARIGVFVPPSDPRVPALTPTADSEEARIARLVGWAVRAAAPWVPFKAVCLQQAMAAHAMLRRRGIASAMHFGAGRDEQRAIDAHAWLDAAGVKVTGYPVAANLTEIGCFV